MSQNIEEKLEKIVSNRNIYRTGTVVRINSFVVETTGLDDVFYFEKVFIGSEKNVGYVDKIESNNVYISIVKEEVPIRIGDSVISTKEPLMSYFSTECMGMIVDMFGNDKLTGKPFNNSIPIMIETPKIGIMERGPVNRPLETGIAAIDMLYPIGRGQRQLIIGDKKIGKTQIALDTICNQRDKDMICIYIAIGKTKKEIKSVYTKLIERGANAYTIIVSAFNDDPVPVLKLTPYVGVSMAEEFLHEGKDVLVIIDDLKKHADACREIALIANKNTGRDAYPADIFYTHSRLLEKGCQHKNGGSITILPIIETKGNDITDYISTNVISITDGQIVLSPKLFEKGQKPAIDYGLSVSRLGSAVQKEQIVDVGATIRKTLLSYLETAEVYELVNEETMTPELKHQLKVGKRILNLLKQPKFTPLSAEDLVSRFEFIYTEEDDTEENVLKNVKEEIKTEEPIIPIAAGLDEALDKAQNNAEFTPVAEIAFEDVDSNSAQDDGPQVEVTSPIVESPIIDAPIVDEQPVVVESPIVEAPVTEEIQFEENSQTEEESVFVESPIVDAPVVEENENPVFVEPPIVESPIVETEEPIVEEEIQFEEIPQTDEVAFVDAPIVEAPIVDAPVETESPVFVESPIVETEEIQFEDTTLDLENTIGETEEPIVEEEIQFEEIPQTEEEITTESISFEEPIVEQETSTFEETSIPEVPTYEEFNLPKEEPVIEDIPTEEESASVIPTFEELPQEDNSYEEIELPSIDYSNEVPIEEHTEIELPLTSNEEVEENPISEIENVEEEIELPKEMSEEEIELPIENSSFNQNLEIELPMEKNEKVEENPISEIEEDDDEIDLPKEAFEEEEIELPEMSSIEDDDDDLQMPTLASNDKGE